MGAGDEVGDYNMKTTTAATEMGPETRSFTQISKKFTEEDLSRAKLQFVMKLIIVNTEVPSPRAEKMTLGQMDLLACKHNFTLHNH